MTNTFWLMFLAFFLFLLSLFWGYLAMMMLWYRVPLISTAKPIRDLMLRAAELENKGVVYELGCGWGHLLFEAVKINPKLRGVGIDVIFPVLWGNRWRARFAQSPVHFYCGDFFRTDLSEADVIFCYLWDTIMTRIYREKWDQLKPGSLVVSHAFPIKDLDPDRVLSHGRSKVYVYRKK